MKRRNTIATAYLLQAVLIALWWVGLGISESFFRAFQFTGIGPLAFRAFLLPDLTIIAGLSVWRSYVEREVLGYVILGGFAYASLYCLNALLLTRSGILPTGVMVLGLCYNLFLLSGEASFRSSRSSGTIINGIKTTIQIICVWTITLVVIPYFILVAFLGQGAILEPAYPTVGLVLLLLCSTLGIASAVTMVRRGDGTPLPLDQTNHLVVTGPYRYVRNPMAVAGIGQGIGVSLTYASLPLLVYALLGGLLWQMVVRPLEEEDLERRFGEGYRRYRERVRCWFPTFR